MEYQSRFGALDMHVCRRAATNIAVEMSAERRAATAEWNARASLAGEMIRGGADAASLQHRADYLGIRLDIARVLCLMTAPPRGRRSSCPTPRTVAAHFVDAGAASVLATAVAEGVVVIVDLPADGPRAAAIAHDQGPRGAVPARRSTRPGGCAQRCRPCAPISRTTSARTRRPAR